ncbi:tetratricopeptide repeat protein, partial [Candidatus Nitrosotalea sp. FS]|uniref:tetratricopeptide repeat protein n=1 Tax=Candidatus Nitrosotalea sp. FS TaxID=2341021 RepID=UPI0037439645
MSEKNQVEKTVLEGISYAKLEKHKDAISFFDKALKQDSTNVDALYNKGMSLLKLKKNKDAMTCFE